MTEWNNNKVVGIISVVVLIICLGFLVNSIFQKMTTNEKRKKEIKQWKSEHMFNEQGEPIGLKKEVR